MLRGLTAGAVCSGVGCASNSGNTVDGGVPGDGSCPGLLCISLTNPANAALKSPGGSAAFPLPNGSDTVIVIRTDATTVVALSDICTHAGCGVSYQSARGQLFCPCHGSIFSLTGQVLRGPAGSPLKVYTATLDSTGTTIDVK